MKTQKEYIKTKGDRCPLCGSTWAEYCDHPNWVSGRKLVAKFKCLDCKCIWEEIYKFKKYLIVSTSDEEFKIIPEEG